MVNECFNKLFLDEYEDSVDCFNKLNGSRMLKNLSIVEYLLNNIFTGKGLMWKSYFK